MSLESHLKEFPSGLSMCSSNDTGIRSEKDFDDIVTQLGHEVYIPKSDNGIDRVVLTANGHRKTVQITAGSCQNYQRKDGSIAPSYTVAKPLSRIRKDVDILAIAIDYRKRVLVELPQVGEVWVDIPQENQKGDFAWFLIPRSVFTHDNITDHYKMTTATWTLNMESLRPPLEKALECWAMLDVEDGSHWPEVFCLTTTPYSVEYYKQKDRQI